MLNVYSYQYFLNTCARIIRILMATSSIQPYLYMYSSGQSLSLSSQLLSLSSQPSSSSMQRSSSRPLSSCSQPSSLSSQPLSSSSQPSSSSSQLSSSSGHIFSSSQSSSSSIQRSSDQPLSLSSQPSSSSSPPLTSFSQPSSPSGQPSSSSRKPFRSRKFLTVEQKKEVIQEVCLGLSPMDVATKYGIGKTQVYKLFKHRATLDFDKGVPNYSKLITTKSKYPDIDKAVYDWMCSIRKTIGNRRPLPVTCDDV